MDALSHSLLPGCQSVVFILFVYAMCRALGSNFSVVVLARVGSVLDRIGHKYRPADDIDRVGECIVCGRRILLPLENMSAATELSANPSLMPELQLM